MKQFGSIEKAMAIGLSTVAIAGCGAEKYKADAQDEYDAADAALLDYCKAAKDNIRSPEAGEALHEYAKSLDEFYFAYGADVDVGFPAPVEIQESMRRDKGCVAPIGDGPGDVSIGVEG